MDEATLKMAGVTLEQAQAQLDALLKTTSLSVRMADRSVTTYTSQDDKNKAIDYWRNLIAQLTAIDSGRSRFGFSLADLRCRRLNYP